MKEMSVAEQRSIDEDRWRSVDLRELDLEDQLSRYIRLRGQKASPDTLATYRRRVGRAIELYLGFLDNPAGFKGASSSRARQQGSAGGRRQPASGTQRSEAVPPAEARHAPPAETSDLVTYPFPLRSGGMAYLQLPRDLSPSDVKRLSSFIESLAIDAVSETEPPRMVPPG